MHAHCNLAFGHFFFEILERIRIHSMESFVCILPTRKTEDSKNRITVLFVVFSKHPMSFHILTDLLRGHFTIERRNKK